MTIEIFLDGQEDEAVIFLNEPGQPTAGFSDQIFSQEVRVVEMRRKLSTSLNLTPLQEKTARVAQTAGQIVRPMGSSKGEVKIEASWGQREGPNISISVSGQASDNKGNYVKGEIKQDNSGQGTVSIVSGHDSENGGSN